MVSDEAVVEVRILLDEGLNVLLAPEDDCGAGEVRQGAAHDDSPVPLELLGQTDVGCSVGSSLGEDILHIGILQDIVRLDGW